VRIHSKQTCFFSAATSAPFRRLLDDVRREFMQHLTVVLHGTPGFHLRDALQEDSADLPPCQTCGGELFHIIICLVVSATFSWKKNKMSCRYIPTTNGEYERHDRRFVKRSSPIVSALQPVGRERAIITSVKIEDDHDD
jgi:hypothetical protein